MTLAALLGLGDQRLTKIAGDHPKLRKEDIALIGVRDLDSGERELIKREKIACFTMKDVDLIGIGAVCKQAIAKITQDTDAFIVSFDFDACDPSLAPAVGTSVRGGLTWREAHLIVELAAEHPAFHGFELIEYAPERDIGGMTAELGIALAESALGKNIL
jgi:arginase